MALIIARVDSGMVTGVLQGPDNVGIEGALEDALHFARNYEDSDTPTGEIARRFLSGEWYEVLLGSNFGDFERAKGGLRPYEVTIEATAKVNARSAAEAEEAVTDALDDGFPEIDYHVVAS